MKNAHRISSAVLPTSILSTEEALESMRTCRNSRENTHREELEHEIASGGHTPSLT